MAKVELTNQEGLDMFNQIEGLQVFNLNCGPKFNYAISRNRRTLKKHAKDISETHKKTLKEFEEKRIEACKENALKDGRKITSN